MHPLTTLRLHLDFALPPIGILPELCLMKNVCWFTGSAWDFGHMRFAVSKLFAIPGYTVILADTKYWNTGASNPASSSDTSTLTKNQKKRVRRKAKKAGEKDAALPQQPAGPVTASGDAASRCSPAQVVPAALSTAAR